MALPLPHPRDEPDPTAGEQVRRTYASSQLHGHSPGAAGVREEMTVVETSNMLLIQIAFGHTRWKSRKQERDVLFALRAILAIATAQTTAVRRVRTDAARSALIDLKHKTEPS